MITKQETEKWNHYNTLYAERNLENFTYKVKRDMSQKPIAETCLAFDLLNSDLDFVIASEDYCVSNYEMAYDLYDLYTGRVFRITFTEDDDYMAGKEITLQGHLPDENEMEAMMMIDPETFPNKEVFRVVR